MKIDLTQVLSAVITLAVALITTFFVPWLKQKVSAEKLSMIKLWTKVAVEAAEQVYKDAGMGKFKKQYVIDFLESKGYMVDEEELDNLIESSVLELKKGLENG